MRIDPSLSLHASRAYAPAVMDGSKAVAVQAAVSADTLAKITPAKPSPLNALVAGRAAGGVSFETSAPRAASSQLPAAFSLYTRAADKVEAAVAVQMGRTVDVRG